MLGSGAECGEETKCLVLERDDLFLFVEGKIRARCKNETPCYRSYRSFAFGFVSYDRRGPTPITSKLSALVSAPYH